MQYDRFQMHRLLCVEVMHTYCVWKELLEETRADALTVTYIIWNYRCISHLYRSLL